MEKILNNKLNYDVLYKIINYIPSKLKFHLLFIDKKINKHIKNNDDIMDQHKYIKKCIENKYDNLIDWYAHMYNLPSYYHIYHIYFNKNHINCKGCYHKSKYICDSKIEIKQNNSSGHIEDIVGDNINEEEIECKNNESTDIVIEHMKYLWQNNHKKIIYMYRKYNLFLKPIIAMLAKYNELTLIHDMFSIQYMFKNSDMSEYLTGEQNIYLDYLYFYHKE